MTILIPGYSLHHLRKDGVGKRGGGVAINAKECSEKTSLRSWRYCVGARLKFWRRSRVPKKGSRDEAVVFLAASQLVTAPSSNLTRLYYNGSAAKSHSTTTQYRQLRRLWKDVLSLVCYWDQSANEEKAFLSLYKLALIKLKVAGKSSQLLFT